MELPCAYEKPPEGIKSCYKKYQKMSLTDLDQDQDMIDFLRDSNVHSMHNLRTVRTIDSHTLNSPNFSDDIGASFNSSEEPGPTKALECEEMPGLQFIPSLLSEALQIDLLQRLLHRDLADARHQTNIHKHYSIPYHLNKTRSNQSRGGDAERFSVCSTSFFNCAPDSTVIFEPLDPAIHKPLTIKQFLNRKLRWITLGGQYDWTEKSYPKDKPPAFPADEAALIRAAFPEMRPEAAIINVYSPGDTLSLHRDVSEKSDQGLVSISIGCDGIFVVGLERASPEGASCLAVRLRSGDAIYMSGPARYAWHGIPRILPGTCPTWLRAWPAQPQPRGEPNAAGGDPDRPKAFEAWRGWMETKRINLNVRQMYP